MKACSAMRETLLGYHRPVSRMALKLTHQPSRPRMFSLVEMGGNEGGWRLGADVPRTNRKTFPGCRLNAISAIRCSPESELTLPSLLRFHRMPVPRPRSAFHSGLRRESCSQDHPLLACALWDMTTIPRDPSPLLPPNPPTVLLLLNTTVVTIATVPIHAALPRQSAALLSA